MSNVTGSPKISRGTWRHTNAMGTSDVTSGKKRERNQQNVERDLHAKIVFRQRK